MGIILLHAIGRILPKIACLFLWLPLTFIPQTTFAYGTYRDVLILHSYHQGLPWTDSIMAGLREGLAGSSDQLHLHIEYLDAIRNPNLRPEVLDSIFDQKSGGRRFDIVVISDNAALAYILNRRESRFAGIPIVFCGINNFRPSMINGFSGITGIAEYPSYRETIELAMRFHPEAREMVIIGGTGDVSREECRRMLAALLKDWDLPVKFTFWDDIPIEELSVRLGALPKNRLVLINGSVSDRSGEILSSVEGHHAIKKAYSGPIYSFWDFTLGEGIIGGKLVSGREQGKLAADIALRILRGENPDSIPVVAEGNRFMFDYLELKRFDLPLDLPKGSVVINQPPPFYALSAGQLWMGLGVMTALTLGLLLNVIWRRRAQLALEEKKGCIDLLLNSTAEAIYGVDPQGSCTFCNQSSLRLLGYRHEDELLGKRIHDLICHTGPDGEPTPECRLPQALRENAPLHGKDEILWRADGTNFPVEYWSHPIRRGDETIGAVVTFLDISERKRAEVEMATALRDLDSFVYTVSHDLRSPLTAIIGFSEYLRDYQDVHFDENAATALAEILNQGERMSSMIEDLLSLAMVGKLPRPSEPVDADEIVKEVLTSFGKQIAAAGISVRAEPLPSARIPATFLTQIFSNLIGNALRYGEGRPIRVGGTREREKVRFFVRDYGPGIPMRERECIFDVFFRGSTGGKTEGTGIGLATVQKITRLYNGRVWVEETPGGGATFHVEMADP